jgi:MoaA/NifB/PqqE/SkfB family radical SAM enzyme
MLFFSGKLLKTSTYLMEDIMNYQNKFSLSLSVFSITRANAKKYLPPPPIQTTLGIWQKITRWIKYEKMRFAAMVPAARSISRFLHPRAIETLEFHVAHHCNLHCMHCIHFSSLAEKDFLDLTSFENDLRQLKHITSGRVFPYIINLLGGEPLLNPALIRFCEIARDIFQDTPIWIATNGTLLSKQPAVFWEQCAKFNITINVTRYPVLIEADRELMEKNAKQHGVLLNMNNNAKEQSGSFFWTKFPMDIAGKQNYKKSHFYCPLFGCRQLRHGKLYPCPRIAYAADFNRTFNQNLEITEHDYLDIYRVTNIEEIQVFLEGPFPFCRYCKSTKNRIVPWQQSRGKRLEDWL